MTDQQFQELMSEIRALAMKIRFIEEDVQEIKNDHLDKLRICIEQLAREDLDSVAQKAKAQLKVERF
jgi:hypothetical protein